MVLRKLDIQCKRIKLDTCLTPYTIINSRWIKDLKVKLQTAKLLAENMGIKLTDISLGNDFLDTTPKAKARKPKTNK